MAVVNRFRGGGFGAQYLPGHPRFWVTPIVAMLALFLVGPLQAVLMALAYLVWCWPPWGYLMTLGRTTPAGRDISLVEQLCLDAALGNIWAALMLRHAFGMLPAMFVVSPFAILAAPLIVIAYELGWRITPLAPIRTAELLTGAIWGALFLLHY